MLIIEFPINETVIVEKICENLSAEQETAKKAADSAREGATHEDAKAENQYDTRGPEASVSRRRKRGRSYLSDIGRFRNIVLKDFSQGAPVGLTAVVRLDDGEADQVYFIAGDAGGMKLTVDRENIMVITPKSPLGQALMGKKKGDFIEVRIRNDLREFEIIDVQ